MIYFFPNADTLKLALTSGLVPPAVSLAPAAAGFDEQGHLWLQPSANVPGQVQAHLRRLGIDIAKAEETVLTENVLCWLQLLPVYREPATVFPAGQTPVLFDLPRAALLPEIVSEIFRLGNDRQGFRFLNDGAGSRALLRVIGPPYYSLLRALEGTDPAGPRAFVERAPRVWVQIGYDHALADHIKPPEGKLVLLQPPRNWGYVDEGPFRDIYEILEFALPATPVRWQDTDPGPRFQVPLRLARAGPIEAAELWVLRDRAVEQLDDLVRDADDQLLSRLAFAVSERAGAKVIAVRARPSKLTPPVLVFAAPGFRPYLKLSNLFVPCGARLHPPLRREAVRKLFADDTGQVTWLYPHPDGTFSPESLPDESFRPLEDWIDYVLDHDRETLQAWVQAAQFDFEPYICRDEEPANVPKKPARQPRQSGTEAETIEVEAVASLEIEVVKKSRPKKEPESVAAALPHAPPTLLQERLHDLEQQFLALEDAPADSVRQDLWRAMGQLNTALGNKEDANVCWVNALWEVPEPPADWARAWLQAEAPASKLFGWMGDDGDILANHLSAWPRRVLETAEPLPADLRTLSAFLTWAGGQTSEVSKTSEVWRNRLQERLGDMQTFLEKHEHFLPIRGIWLAWTNLVKLSHGDVLALARTRDRLLERLFHNGLSSDLDLPTFLRFSGLRATERFRNVRERILHLRELAQRWIALCLHADVNDVSRQHPTNAYADMIFAFGLARLGEGKECRQLQEKAKEILVRRDDVHSFLLEAFSYRIQQALEGKPHGGPLPLEQREYLEHMGGESKHGKPPPRYLVDRLRQYSRILEPQEKVDPFRMIRDRVDNLGQELAGLADIADKQQLADRIGKLLKMPLTPRSRLHVLAAALETAPRVGETFTLQVLSALATTLDALPAVQDLAEVLDRADLLDRATFLAAHFDREEQVRNFVERFRTLLEWQRGEVVPQVLESRAGQFFHGLRRFGLRAEIEGLLDQVVDLVLAGRKLSSLRSQRHHANWLATRRTLLHVASVWLHFDQVDRATLVLDEVRAVLFEEELIHHQKSDLACTYAATLGEAPVELALQRIEEIFQKLGRIGDPFTTSSHYSLSQLRVVEGVVWAVVNEQFAQGQEVRRWLDHDEFLVRRRIHRDVRTALGETSH